MPPQDSVQLVALTVLLPLCLLRDFRFLTPVVKVPRARVAAAPCAVSGDPLRAPGTLGTPCGSTYD